MSHVRSALKDGNHHNPDMYFPFANFWKVVGEMQIPVIVGLDAHDPHDFDYNYNEDIQYFIDTFNLKIIENIPFH